MSTAPEIINDNTEPEPSSSSLLVEAKASVNPENDVLLQQFWSLASLDAAERQKAALTLVNLLSERQRAFSRASPSSFQELGISIDTWQRVNPADGPLDMDEQLLTRLCHSDLVYALHRLVRGLASGRAAARQGFALALTELLASLLPFVPASFVVQLLKRSTQTSSGAKGYEERDALYGQLFGYMALIRGGRLATEMDASVECIDEMVKEIVLVGDKKPYLREFCAECLIALYQRITSDNLIAAFQQSLLSEELSSLIGTNPTADFLTLAIVMQNGPQPCDLDWETMLSAYELKQPSQILHSSNFASLVPILRESTANSHPRVHIIWSYILESILNKDVAAVQDFWRVIVDEGLFTSNHEKKFLGMQLFERIIRRMSQDRPSIPSAILFTPNFMNCLFNNITNNTSNLHKSAQSVFSALLSASESNRSIALQFLASLSGSKTNSLAHIRKAVKNKQLLDDLLQAGLSGDDDEKVKSVADHVEWLIKSFCDQSEIEEDTPSADGEDADDLEKQAISSVDIHRRWCLDQMISLVKSTKIVKHESWIMMLLRFLISNSFYDCFAVNGNAIPNFPELQYPCSPPLSPWMKQLMRKRFWSLVTEISVRKFAGEKSELMEGFIAANEHILWHALQYINELDGHCKAKPASKKSKKSPKSSPVVKALRVEWDQELEQIVSSAQKLIMKLHAGLNESKEDRKIQNRQRSFLLLLILVTLQMLTSLDEDEAGELAGILEELQLCNTKLFSKKKATQNDLNPVSVLTDLIISLLARQPEIENDNSAEGVKSSTTLSVRLSRQICETIFRSICLDIDSVGIQTLGKVIDPYLASDGGDVDMIEEEEEDNEDDEDEHSHSDHESSDDEKDSDDEASESDIDEKFKMQVEEALKSSKPVEDDSDDDLNDEQMFSLGFDEKLSEIFRNRKVEQKQKRSTVQFMADFKFRILDLVDIYARQIQHASNRSESFDLVSTLDTGLFLLRAALSHANTVGAIASAKAALEGSEDKEKIEALLMRLNTNVSEIPIDRRNILSTKMLAIVKNRLVKVHPNRNVTVNVEDIKLRLREFSELLTGSSLNEETPLNPTPVATKEVISAASDAFLWCVRCLVQSSSMKSNSLEQTHEELKSLFSDCFLPRHVAKSGKSHLPASIFIDSIRKNIFAAESSNAQVAWKIFGAKVLDLLRNGSESDKIKIGKHQQSQLWFLLSTLIRHTDTSAEWWITDYSAEFKTLSLETIQSLSSMEMDSLKSQRIKDMLLVMMEALRKMKKSSSEWSSSFGASEFIPLLISFCASEVCIKLPAVRNLAQQFLSLLGAQKEKQKKVKETPAAKQEKPEKDKKRKVDAAKSAKSKKPKTVAQN